MKVIAQYNFTAPSSSPGGKWYQIEVQDMEDTTFRVMYSYAAHGRNGSPKLKRDNLTLQTAQAIADDMCIERVHKKGYEPNDIANDAFNKLLNKGGSTQSPKAVPVVIPESTSINKMFTAPLYQLYEKDAETYLSDDAYWMQQKHDGERRVGDSSAGKVKGYGRYERQQPLTREIMDALGAQDCKLDAEEIGNTLHAFDILSLNGKDLTAMPFEKRYKKLVTLIKKLKCPSIKLVKAFVTEDEKRKEYDRLVKAKVEGVVFKDSTCAYRPATDATIKGGQFKLKFYNTATFIVLGHSAKKRSVEIGIMTTEGKIRSAKNVTIPQNAPMPMVTSMIEVRYLYAYPGGGLAEPTYDRLRTDVLPARCTESQLHFKTEEQAAA